VYPVKGGCYCGNILIQVELSQKLDDYHPRACDCGFCSKHGAAYVSDAKCTLSIRIEDRQQAPGYRQGNELAEMLLCGRCGVLVGALYREDGRVYATINVKALEGAESCGAEQAVSPKRLSAEEKVARWKKLWFPDVKLES
jgi:hypothetical protein